jgi:hypothetical protein
MKDAHRSAKVGAQIGIFELLADMGIRRLAWVNTAITPAGAGSDFGDFPFAPAK